MLKKNTRFGALRGLALAGTIGACSVGVGNAALVFDFSDSGTSLVVTVSGSIDTTDATSSGVVSGGIGADFGAIQRTDAADSVFSLNSGAADRHIFSVGAANRIFGGANFANTGTISGDTFGFAYTNSADSIEIFTNGGYTSGDAINGTVTIANLNVSDLSLDEQVFNVQGGSGETIAFTSSVSVPEPSGLAFLAVGAISLFARRQRK